MGGRDDTLHVTRDHLRTLLCDIDQVIVVCDSDGIVTFIGGAVTQTLGYDPKTVEGRNIFDFLRPESYEAILESLVRWTDRAGAPAGEVHDVLAQDGSWLPMRYDVVTGPDVAVFGPFVLTLRSASTDTADRRVLLEKLLNEDRLVRLAAAFLHHPVEKFDLGVDEALSELAALDWVTRVSVWQVDRTAGTSPMLVHARRRAEWTANAGAPVEALPERARMDASPILRRLRDLEEVHIRSVDHLPDDWSDARRWLQASGVRSMLAVPMVVSGEFGGFVMAEITLDEIAFDVPMVSTLRSAAAIFASAFQRHEAEVELARRASTDELTGLANRWSFREHLDHALDAVRNGASDGLVVAVINLDRFTRINAALGHEAGDQLLVDSARRMSRALPEGSLLASAQSDEFLLLVPGCAEVADGMRVAERLLHAITPPYEVDGELVTLTASAGVASAIGADEAEDADAGELTRGAEVAMRKSRQLGGGRVEVDAPELRSRVASRLRREAELHAAVKAGAITVHYQPEWDLETRSMIGAEALARWDHPSDGLLAAGDFISLAEESGFIADVGVHVLREACSAVAGVDLHPAQPFELKVNVSTRQLDSSLPDLVRDVLEETGYPPERLCFELTESALLVDPEGAVGILQALRDQGVGLAIDDFGTGYSSMLYLKRLPVTLLKIDQSFVAGLPDDDADRAIVRATVQLASSLAIDVTAEGVETEAQVRALLDLGCTRGQGFLLGRPAPVDHWFGPSRT